MPPGDGLWPMPGVHLVAALPTTSSRWEPHAIHLTVPQPFQQYGGAFRFGGLAENHLIPLPSLHGGEGSSFLCNAPPNDMVNTESVVGLNLVILRW